MCHKINTVQACNKEDTLLSFYHIYLHPTEKVKLTQTSYKNPNVRLSIVTDPETSNYEHSISNDPDRIMIFSVIENKCSEVPVIKSQSNK